MLRDNYQLVISLVYSLKDGLSGGALPLGVALYHLVHPQFQMSTEYFNATYM